MQVDSQGLALRNNGPRLPRLSEDSSFADNLSVQAQVDNSPPRFDFRQMQFQIEAQQRQYAVQQNIDNESSHGTQHMRDQ